MLTIVVLLLVSQLLAISPVEKEMLEKGVFAARRQAFMEKMDGGIAIIKSSVPSELRAKGVYEYELDRYFYYLTGCSETGIVLVLIPGAKEEFIMFVEPRNIRRELWGELHIGIEGAKKIFGAQAAFPVKEFKDKIGRYLWKADKIYLNFKDPDFVKEITQKGTFPAGKKIIDSRGILDEMRLIKGPEELEIMQKSIDMTVEGLNHTMRAAEPGMFEYHLEAFLQYAFRKHNSRWGGGFFIVASGPNGSMLHYEKNDRRTVSGDLVLIDTGAEYHHYYADITRTFPINGKFTPKQKEIYNLVLKAQEAGIQSVKPGTGVAETWTAGMKVLAEGLFKLGLITDPSSRWQPRVWARIGMLGHWLGMDVHDVGDYQRMKPKGRKLEPGMVVTVEPGIYIDASLLDKLHEIMPPMIKKEEIDAFVKKVKPVAEKYNQISIRIEDDVLVTKDGHRIMSAGTPKKIRDIEKLMKQKSPFNKL